MLFPFFNNCHGPPDAPSRRARGVPPSLNALACSIRSSFTAALASLHSPTLPMSVRVTLTFLTRDA